MNKENYDSLMGILDDLRGISKEIEHKKKKFETQLCNPSLDPYKAFGKYISLKNEIDFMEWKVKTFKQIVKQLKDRERSFLKMMMYRKSIFCIEKELGMNYHGVSKRVDYYAELFKKVLKRPIKESYVERENNA